MHIGRFEKMEKARLHQRGAAGPLGEKWDYANKLKIQNNAAEGYISERGVPPQGIPAHYYLHLFPSGQLVLNTNLVQNPGWK